MVRSMLVLSLTFFCLAATNAQKSLGIYAQYRHWTDMQKVLNDSVVVVIPLGAQAKEHGPHLLLENDWRMAEYLASRIAVDQRVVIYPTINYSFYPAFLEYAGSTSIRFETAYSMIVDLCRVISTHGPKKFYILNTGVSTMAPLKVAKQMLGMQGILMSYTDILHVAGDAEQKVKQQPAGTHADEIETSIMLYIAPGTVDMAAAARDIPKDDGPGPLTLDSTNTFGRYSPTGIYGDATLATRAKGEVVVEAMVA
ncbi:MAG TPA: creatininase family protein, partial [Cyclobacteriaceae bacterium]|nr:creatininase family protein [Cyclobacteriaceae bacterium]